MENALTARISLVNVLVAEPVTNTIALVALKNIHKYINSSSGITFYLCSKRRNQKKKKKTLAAVILF
jgi:hypothetical protein